MNNDNACATAARSERRAFTLTELLVVIAIIAVLAAMGSWGAMQALGTAKQSRIKLEVDQLDAAFKTYKDKYGSYPPCNFSGLSGNPGLKPHIARAFPRYNLAELDNDLKAAGLDPAFRPDQALVFWLSGFSPDPQHPFVTPGPNPNQPGVAVKGAQIINGVVQNSMVKVAVPLFDFDVTRLAVVDNNPPINSMFTANGIVASYFPAGIKPDPTGAPYLYWSAEGDSFAYKKSPIADRDAYLWNDGGPGAHNIFPNAGPAVAYTFDVDNDLAFTMADKWANDDSFQIISSGADGKYGNVPSPRGGPTRLYPTRFPLGADDDNVTNFCQKARLGDARP